MKERQVAFSLIITVFFCLIRLSSFAQTDPIEHLWYNEEKTAKIQIYKNADGKFFGKIVWLKEPLKDGHTKIDIHNPDKKRQNDPIIGMLILKDFKKHGEKLYENGTIYDPKNGKKYSCTLTYKDAKLDVHGYVGFSFIGRSAIWTIAE